MKPTNSYYPVCPHDIKAERIFPGDWTRPETNISAGWIIAFLQERDQGWGPFSKVDIENYYQDGGYAGFRFNELSPRYIEIKNKVCHVTHDFVERCYNASPNRPGLFD